MIRVSPVPPLSSFRPEGYTSNFQESQPEQAGIDSPTKGNTCLKEDLTPVSHLKTSEATPTYEPYTTESEPNKGTLSGLTTHTEHYTRETRLTDPIDLTSSMLSEIRLDSQVAELQKSVVRLRVEVDGETLGSGSGIIISSDGLILSVNHVPATGQRDRSMKFGFLPGTNVLRNLKSWNELLGQEGNVKLIADFPLVKERESLLGNFPYSFISKGPPFFVKKLFGLSSSATCYGPDDNTVKLLSLPVKIIAESPQDDLMLARVIFPGEQNEPCSFIKLSDDTPQEGDLVYSIGHPISVKHNVLALGEVLDPNFNVEKIKRAFDAQKVVLDGIAGIFKCNPTDENLITTLVRYLSLCLADTDVQPLVRFVNGAIISTNKIDHGSSGGLLCNWNGEAVGVTYLGIGLPLNNTPLIRYLGGTLGLHPKQLPLSSITGSISVRKAIPFLETHGVNISKIRDGEPSGIENIEEKARRNKARLAMAELFRGQELQEGEIEQRLKDLGI